MTSSIAGVTKRLKFTQEEFYYGLRTGRWSLEYTVWSTILLGLQKR
jgi:hypothetical protein